MSLPITWYDESDRRLIPLRHANRRIDLFGSPWYDSRLYLSLEAVLTLVVFFLGVVVAFLLVVANLSLFDAVETADDAFSFLTAASLFLLTSSRSILSSLSCVRPCGISACCSSECLSVWICVGFYVRVRVRRLLSRKKRSARRQKAVVAASRFSKQVSEMRVRMFLFLLLCASALLVVRGGSTPCDDGDACTLDVVVALDICRHRSIPCPPLPGHIGVCAPSTGTCEYIDDTDRPRRGEPSAEPECVDDGDACTDEIYDGLTRTCLSRRRWCDDGDACTEDSCDPTDGRCVHAPTTRCRDNDPRTTDLCNSVTGKCTHHLSARGEDRPRRTGRVCDDGDACTLDVCLDGECSHVSYPFRRCDHGTGERLDDGRREDTTPATEEGGWAQQQHGEEERDHSGAWTFVAVAAIVIGGLLFVVVGFLVWKGKPVDDG